MKKNQTISISKQKKTMRNLKSLIVILFAFIGILKISIGGVVNVPVALLIGDFFISFFVLVIVFTLYFMLVPLPLKRKRLVFVTLAIVGLHFVGSGIYGAVLRDFGSSSLSFSASLDEMLKLARESIQFTASKDNYWYGYAGIIGEGLTHIFKPLGKAFTIVIYTFLIIGLLVIIFWPVLVWLASVIKEYFRDLKKRKKVLHNAGLVNHETPKDTPTQVLLEELVQEKDVPQKNPLLKRVGKFSDEIVESEEKPIFKKEQLPVSTIEETPFILPTLDSEDKIEAVDSQVLNEPNEESGKETFEDLQKAVNTSGSINAVSFNETTQETKNDLKVEPKAEEEAPKVNELPPFTNDLPEFRELKNEPAVRLKETQTVYKLPNINLLDDPLDSDKSELNRMIAIDYEQKINEFFRDFNIGARVVAFTIGSTFTRFEIQLEPTETLKAITPIVNDISLRLNGASVRFEPIIPGKSTSGLEVANTHRTIVNFKECMQKMNEAKPKGKFLIPFGKDVAGTVISASFSDFPHLLVAGSTGSGKSVFIHTVLTSLIMKHSPDELRLILIDPKRVELAQYANIPHLLTPIIKEPSEGKVALDRLITEMEQRYKMFEETGVSKISDYNEIAPEIGKPLMPIIVTIVDEFADLFESEKEVSSLVLRLVQKSRAAGIHLLIATQRPSVQVITGNIKANIPSRVAFMTASAVDSGTILGQGGAETLLGYGDMLVDSIAIHNRGFLRIQAPFLPVKEVLRITNYLRTNYMTNFHPDFLDLKEKVVYYGTNNGSSDELYPSVLEFVNENETISISRIQQQFGVGWPRAKQLYDMLLSYGVIEAPDEANSAKGAVVVKNKRR